MARIHLVQLDTAWEDKPESRRRAQTLLDRTGPKPGDLIALPEMWETGFSMNVERTADDGSGAQWLRDLAQRTGCTAMGGTTALDPGAKMARNRALVFGPAGEDLAAYDKVHPFSYGREAERFEGGDRVRTFEWDGLRCCPVICYDLRFPELFRAGRSLGAEAFIVIANWPEARASHWTALLRARAIENQAAVFGVNRCGKDPFLSYRGDTVAFDWMGEPMGELDSREGVLSTNIDAAALLAWRKKFPAWDDARKGLLGPLSGDGRFGADAQKAQKTPDGA